MSSALAGCADGGMSGPCLRIRHAHEACACACACEGNPARAARKLSQTYVVACFGAPRVASGGARMPGCLYSPAPRRHGPCGAPGCRGYDANRKGTAMGLGEVHLDRRLKLLAGPSGYNVLLGRSVKTAVSSDSLYCIIRQMCASAQPTSLFVGPWVLPSVLQVPTQLGVPSPSLVRESDAST